MRRSLTLVSLWIALSVGMAQDALSQGTAFTAVPGQKGGQDPFGAYDVVEIGIGNNWRSEFNQFTMRR